MPILYRCEDVSKVV